MEKVIEMRGETDFVWAREIEKEATTLVTFYQNEQGFASFIAGASLVGEAEPVCSILSKLHQVDPLNVLPGPILPEWRLYELRNEDGRRYFILRINHAYIPSQNHTKAWLYNYPVFRDIMMVLTEKGVDESIYITANIMQEFVFSDQAQIPTGELLVYDYDEKDDGLFLTDGSELVGAQLDIPPPSWIAASCFNHFGPNEPRGNYIVMCSHTNMTFVNEDEAEILLDFFENTHALLPDEKYKSELLEVLNEAEATYNV